MIQEFDIRNFGKMEKYAPKKYIGTGGIGPDISYLRNILTIAYGDLLGRYVRLLHGDMIIFLSRLKHLRFFEGNEWAVALPTNETTLLAFRVDADYDQFDEFECFRWAFEDIASYENDIIIFYKDVLYKIDKFECDNWIKMKTFDR